MNLLWAYAYDGHDSLFVELTMSDREIARDKAARLLKKRGSISSSAASNDNLVKMHRKHG